MAYPKINPQRRNARVGPLILPAEGREGLAPAWPLPDPASPEETVAWDQLWSTPQAVAWEKLGWTRTVARYCRIMVESERPGAKADVRGAASTMEDRLGLTPKAMRLLLWAIAEDETASENSVTLLPARRNIKAV
jgi:hypothetical protein